MRLKILILVGCAVFGGCTSNQKFDCPKMGGVRCQNMSEIDKLIDLDNQKKETPFSPRKYYTPPQVYFNSPARNNKISGIVRTKEEVIQLWIAAYESENGVYHHPAYINMVLTPAKWDGTH